MPERFESDPFKKKYTNLLRKLEKYNISESDLNDYMYVLEKKIEGEIEDTGRIPEYAYRMIIIDVQLYEFREYEYLELLCGFDIIKGNREDVTVVGPFLEDFIDSNGNFNLKEIEDLNDNTILSSCLLPSSARAIMDLSTGEYSSSVIWREINDWRVSIING